MKQTAVEWLKEQIECFGNKHELQMSWATLDELFEQAKEIEKERMIQFCIDWFTSIEMNIREYYEQEYGGNK